MSLTVRFVLPRPAGHYGTGRNAGRIKASAPPWPETMPDLDKLVRLIDDSITDAGTVWGDDAQVARITASKWYQGADDPPAAHITVQALDVTLRLAEVPPLWVDVPVNGTLL